MDLLKKVAGCSHRHANGESARQAPLHACSQCGKLPAILGVLPYTKKEQEFIATRDLTRAALKATA